MGASVRSSRVGRSKSKAGPRLTRYFLRPSLETVGFRWLLPVVLPLHPSVPDYRPGIGRRKPRHRPTRGPAAHRRRPGLVFGYLVWSGRSAVAGPEWGHLGWGRRPGPRRVSWPRTPRRTCPLPGRCCRSCHSNRDGSVQSSVALTPLRSIHTTTKSVPDLSRHTWRQAYDSHSE